MLDPETIPRLMAAGTIEVAPLAYMRGRTLNDAFIILDEAQNTTPEQMKMFLTRLGFGSKIVVTGDVTQVDLPGGQRSGLQVVREILVDIDDVHFSTLTSADVVRHRLVGDIVDAYERWDATTGRDPDDRRPPGRRGGVTGSASDRGGRTRPAPHAAGPGRDDGDGPMSIEVANESGVDVDEPALVSVSRYALDRMRHQPAGGAVHPAGGRGRDDRTPRQVDGRARSDRRDELPDGRAGHRPPAGRGRTRAGPARRRGAVPGRRRRPGGQRGGTAWTTSCTC